MADVRPFKLINLRVQLLSAIAYLLCIFGFMTQDGGFGGTFPFLPPQGFGIPMIVMGALFMAWAGVVVFRRAKAMSAMSEAIRRESKS